MEERFLKKNDFFCLFSYQSIVLFPYGQKTDEKKAFTVFLELYDGFRDEILYPSGMRISGRCRCNCFYDKKIHNMKTGKFNRDE